MFDIPLRGARDQLATFIIWNTLSSEPPIWHFGANNPVDHTGRAGFREEANEGD
jgi:hypothetical protein